MWDIFTTWYWSLPTYMYLLIIFVMIMVACIVVLYSSSQYRELKHLFKAQQEADDTVYEGLKHSNIAEKFLFRLTTKDVEHYYER